MINSLTGYGIWIETRENKVFKYHIMGYDPGVSFRSSIYPELGITLVIPSNKGQGRKINDRNRKSFLIIWILKKRYKNNLNGFMIVSILKNILVNEKPFI